MFISSLERDSQRCEAIFATNDYVFKRLFGRKGNEDITIDLLNSILSDKIVEISLDENPILEKDIKDDKIGILDIKATINKDVSTDIEMQVVEKSDIEKRLLFYWSKLYIKGIESGEDYSVLNKTICILIVAYELDNLEELKNYHTEWKIIETKYRKTVLTPVFEIHIINLRKLEILKNEEISIISPKDKKLLEWCKFIKNSNKKYEGENEMIKKAQKELDKMKQDTREQMLAELRLKYILDQNATEKYGFNRGFKEGISRGIEQGIEQGSKNKSHQIAKKMLKNGVKINEIKEYTGLSEKEIESLNEND